MPIYEYECTDHGHRFEVIQKITDNPLKTCTICNSPVRRLISATAFHLKGGGWYSDAYSGAKAPGAKTGPAAPDKGDKKPAESPKETKKESSTPSSGDKK